MRQRTTSWASATAWVVPFVIGAASPAAAGLVLDLRLDRINNIGVPTASLSGGGDPARVIRAAAAYWEAAFADSPQVVRQTIYFGWSPIDSVANAFVNSASNFSGDASSFGGVTFDNDGGTQFFVDPTPYAGTEYASFQTTRANLGGGGPMVVGRRHFNPTTAAAGQIDLLTVTIHELGHALGIVDGFGRWERARTGDGNRATLDVSAPRPFAGADIPVDNSHIPLVTNTMAPGVGGGERKLLTEADILAMAEVHGFTNVNLDPRPIPEPSALLLGVAATTGLPRRRRSVRA